MTVPAAPRTVFFRDFRFERPRGLFRRNERGEFIAVAIGSRALEILAVFIERAGELVSKDEMMEAVWPGTVVEYSNLAVQIGALRRVLDGADEDRSCIQTVAGRGYRFIVPVTFGDYQSSTGQMSASGDAAAPATAREVPTNWELMRSLSGDPSPNWFWWPAWRWGVGTAVALAFAMTVVWVGWGSHNHQRVAAGAESHLSIIVLPFANLNSNGEQSHFAQAITEDLATDLSRIQDIVVIPASNSFIYGDRPINAKRLASEFRAHYVLEGSTHWSRDGVRINAQLIDAESGANLWSRRIDRDVDDDLALESEISGHLAASLKYALVSSEAARPTDHPDAWNYIFRGRTAFYNPSSRKNYDGAVRLFSRALELNPRSTEAKLYMAIVFAGRVLDAMSDEKQVDLDRAQRLIDQAQADAPRSLLLHFATAQLLRALGRCDEAMIEYETVLASDPNWFNALSHLGRCKTYLGQVAEGIALQQKVIGLASPDDNIGITYFRLGEAYMLKSRPDEAIHWLEKARVAQPAMGYVHGFLASAYALEQQPEKAAHELAEARRLTPWRYSSIATEYAVARESGALPNSEMWATLLDGLRKAGVPD